MSIIFLLIKSFLIVACTASGLVKIFQPIESLVLKMYWVEHFPKSFVRFIGFYEIFCAIGFLLSLLLKQYSYQLTILTSFLLSIFMFGAMATNIFLRRPDKIIPSLSFFTISIYILYKYFSYSI